MAERRTALYRRALGAAFDVLPVEIREMHEVLEPTTAVGRCEIMRGTNGLTYRLGDLFGLPPAGAAVPLSVRFLPEAGREVWRRDFGGVGLRTTQEACSGRPGHLIERLGPLAFLLEVPVNSEGLRLVLRRVWFCGLPVPRVLWPRIDAGERVVEGSFAFDVRVGLPLLGLLVHYRGRLRGPNR